MQALRLSRVIALLVSVGACACAAHTHSTASPHAGESAIAVDSASAAHALVDVTGTWATGSSAEPNVRRVQLRLECNYTPPLWILQQSGDTVRAFLLPEGRAQGARPPDPPPNIPAKGRLSGLSLTLEKPGSRYVLRYDSASGHLRGTLNGQPFWAVREDVIRATGCIPPP